jgi:hypothetical protein
VVGRRVSPPSPEGATSSQIVLPHLVADPVWSLKQWPVEVEVAGEVFLIPAMCAADWLQILMVDNLDPEDVFPGLLDVDEAALIEDRLHAGEFDLEEFYTVALDVVATVSGRPWWVALRLINVAKDSWDALGGELAQKGDATRLSLAAWLDVLFLLVVRNIEDSKRNMFLMKLEIAPEGWGIAPEETMEMSGDAFLAMAG